ncbi:hypothetical protein KIN20_000548 [Parelaphostrongylus tenuis]|uniref:Uncharacterized protein n=1 Tax=Parelaphostrongylus tenuis TaxID=148309 RepID=A0AAD5QBX4_PARTN|nr:hypothetical protein KIN20_000548 [Parelaphostrongylus tenuis]
MELLWEQNLLDAHAQMARGENASEAARDYWSLKRYYGCRKAPRKWFAKLKVEDNSVKDQPCSGRSQEVDRQAVLEMIDRPLH